MSRKIFRFFRRPSTQYLTLDMILAECKQLPDISVTSKSTMRKRREKLRFCYKWRNKKMHVFQQFDFDVVRPVCDFIKNETPKHLFSFEFWEIFQPATSLRARIQNMYSCKFCKDFKDTYFARNPRRTASNDMIMARFFCKTFVILLQGHQRWLQLKNFYLPF